MNLCCLQICFRRFVPRRSEPHHPGSNALLFWWGLFALIGCTQDPCQETKPAPQPIRASLCTNELELLQDPRNNWEVSIDSIQGIDDYHRRCRKKISGDGTPRDFAQQAKVFPYIIIDSIKVSLMHVLRPSGGGYFGYANESLMIYYEDAIDNLGKDIAESVRDFYVNFDANTKHEERGIFWLQGPMVKLIFGDESFSGIRVAIKKIAMGYLQGLSILSKRFYGADLCALDSGQLGELKLKYPLKIRLLKRYISKSR